MKLAFTLLQRRVLGVLIEKSMSTPGAYPLTLNTALVGCNQLSCREPVMKLTEDEVARGLRELMEAGFVTELNPTRNARVERFSHNMEEQVGWNQYKQAIIAELLLRGPQTPGELKTNGSRLAPLLDLDAVGMILDALSTEDPPIVRKLPRQPGKNASRYSHLLSSEPEPSVQEAEAAPTTPQVPHPPELGARVTALEQEVAELRQELQNLKRESGVPGEHD